VVYDGKLWRLKAATHNGNRGNMALSYGVFFSILAWRAKAWLQLAASMCRPSALTV